MIEKFDLLICLQGYPDSRPAMEYGLALAEILHRPVTVLGVTDRSNAAPLEELISETTSKLTELGIVYQVVRLRGVLDQVVPQFAQGQNFITLFNAPPQPVMRRLVYGGRFRHMMAALDGPIIRVHKVCLPIQKILVSTGALASAVPIETLAYELASLTKARVTLMHVVPPVNLDYEIAREAAAHWKDLLETDTPQAAHLKDALERARQLGVEVELCLRHGPVVEEILAQARAHQYDLIAMGSPYSSHNLRRLYRPNVTASVAAEVDCPLITFH